MKTIDLTTATTNFEELLDLAGTDNLLIRDGEGRIFLLAEIDAGDADDDFAHEVELTRQNTALMELLTQRSQEPGKYTIDQVREKLGLKKLSEA